MKFNYSDGEYRTMTDVTPIVNNPTSNRGGV